MTIFEYARRIDEVAGLDLDLDCEEIDLQDKFLLAFLVFMPDCARESGVFAATKWLRAASTHNADLCRHGVADAGGVWLGRGSRIFLPAAGSEIL